MSNKELARKIEVGSTWLHFKGVHTAVIITKALHTETNEQLVIYECYDSKNNELCGVFARPMSMFLSVVDRDKYPDCKYKYRFTRMN